MSTLSQSIPNLLSGISQQPDSRKRPGQLKDAVNAFPDFALGLLKRPGGKFVAKLPNAVSSGKWFPILRDTNEKYIVQYVNNRFHVWDLADGDVRAVEMGAGQGATAGTCLIADQIAKAKDYNDKVAATATALTALQAAEVTLSQAIAAQYATTESLFDFRYDYNNTVVENLHSGIAENANGVYIVKDNGTVVSATTTLPANYALSTERTSEHPLIASTGFRVYEAEKTTAATNSPVLATAEAAYTAAKNAHGVALTAEAASKVILDAQVANCAITNAAINATSAYLKGADPEDIELLTINDYTFVLNKKKTVALDPATTHSGGVLDANRAQVVINIAANSTNYEVLLTQSSTTTTFSHTSASSGASADSIASALASSITANAAYTATQVGASVYITSSNPFTVETRGGNSESSIFALTDTIGNIARLPLQSKDGYVVKIVNAEDIDIDDMYVKFTTDGGGTFGTGQWEESTAPDIKFRFDPLTMPHALVRKIDANGNKYFEFEAVNWNDRVVGDDNTNPAPSFVDHEISHIFFYRNRMGFLSGQNVILGKAGDLFNFWNTSAQTATNDDPVDISAAGKKPVFLNYVEPTAVGLVMYSTTEQFLLSTDSDILSPRSAKVNTLSGYEADANVESVSLGTSQAFVTKTPLYTRLFELNDISSEQPPLMADVTATVPELIPAAIDTIVASPALSIVSLGQTGTSTVYQYRFLAKTRDERLVNSWYKWNLTGTLLTQFFDSSTWYAVVANGNDVYVQSFDMTQSSEQGFLTLPTGEKTDVCLDLFTTNPHRTYDAATDKTSIWLPYTNVGTGDYSLVILANFGTVMTFKAVDPGDGRPFIKTSGSDKYLEVDGDYRGIDMVIGQDYEMTVDLPKIYRYNVNNNQVTNDDVSSLIIHRIKVKTGLSGPVDYKISITGLNDWTNTVSVTQPNQYQLNNVNMQASSTHVVPIYQRNENLAIRIEGTTPFPVSLLGLDWEGKLNQRFYRRG